MVVILLVGVMVVIFRVVVVVVMAMVAVVMGFEVVHVLLVVGMGEQRGYHPPLKCREFPTQFCCVTRQPVIFRKFLTSCLSRHWNVDANDDAVSSSISSPFQWQGGGADVVAVGYDSWSWLA